jgi:hypothetical protein
VKRESVNGYKLDAVSSCEVKPWVSADLRLARKPNTLGGKRSIPLVDLIRPLV